MRNRESKKIALCGILTAASAVVMFLGGLFPFATFTAPAVAGMFLLPLMVEYGAKAGLSGYAAVSLLVFFLVPSKEISLIFIFFFGYYPVIKMLIERKGSKIIKYAIKFVVFNVSVISMYSVMIMVFPISQVVEDFAEGGTIYAVLLILMGNVAFVIYDIAVSRIIMMYKYVLRPRVMKS